MLIQGLDVISSFPIVIFVLLILGGVATAFIKPAEFKNTRTRVFISITGSVAVIILSINVVISTVGFQRQNAVNRAQFTKDAVDKLWLFPNQLLTEKTHARPEFYASLYYNNIDLYNFAAKRETAITMDSMLEEQYIAIVLIQAWEDFLTLRQLDATGDGVWINNFLQWAQSPYLKKIFENLKYNYAEKTIAFGSLLFEYAAELPVPCLEPDTYKTSVDKILKDSRLAAILGQ